MKPKNATATLVAWSLFAVASFVFAGPQIEALGLYYDEAFLAQQARDFTDPERAAVHPPSVTTGELFGRPFPIRNAAYLGSLKSQLVIPSFALFGATKSTLRFTVLATSLLALLFAMLAVHRVFDQRVAIAMGALVASDPSFHFFAQFEWGPFASLFLCRSLGIFLLLLAVERRSPLIFLASGICFGLGVYSRVDFAVIVFVFALATAMTARSWSMRVVREQRVGVLLACAGFGIAAIPVALVVADIVSAGNGVSGRGDLAYRVDVLRSTLDGSHWARLLDVGGRFELMFEATQIASVFPWLLGASGVSLLVLAWRGEALDRQRIAWISVATFGLAAAMLSISGAVRAHHMLNLIPLPQLCVAVALASAMGSANRSGPRGIAMVATCSVALALAVASNLAIVAATAETIRDTGGTGRFSRAVEDFAASLEAETSEDDVEVVSLDWGLHLPIHFSTARLRSLEPIWQIADAARRGARWSREGDAKSIYLYREGESDVFGLGEMFARVVAIHGEGATVTEHRDGLGHLVFKSIRFTRRHTLSFERRGDEADFRLRWRDEALPRPAPAVQR